MSNFMTDFELQRQVRQQVYGHIGAQGYSMDAQVEKKVDYLLIDQLWIRLRMPVIDQIWLAGDAQPADIQMDYET